MGEDESGPPKALPAPEEKKEEEKKRNLLTISIDLDDLWGPIPEIPIPENQRFWTSMKEMPPEYQKMNSLLQTLMYFIVRTCNEGEEVRDNIAKRMILARTLLAIFFDNLNANGYTKYGMLYEMLQETFMSISGKQLMAKILAEIQIQKDLLSKEKAKTYTS